MNLDYAEQLTLYLVLIVGLCAAPWRLAVRGLSWAAAVRLLVVLGIAAAIVATLVPYAPIEPNNHGVARWASAHDGLMAPTGGESHHGKAWFVLIKPWVALTGGLVDATVLSHGLALLAALVGGLAARLASGDDRRGLVTTALLALLPTQLLAAPTVTPFVASQLTLAAGLLGVELFLAGGGAGAIVLTGCATTLAMQTHLELMALAPVVVVGWLLARRPEAARELVRTRAFWITATFMVLATIPFLLSLRVYPPPTPMTTVISATAARALVARLVLATAAGLLVAATIPTPSRRAGWVFPAALLGVLVVTAPDHLSRWQTPVDLRETLPVRDPRHLLHALWMPDLTPPLWLGVLVLGLLHLVRHEVGLAVWTLVTAGVMLALYGGQWDSTSTAIRGSLPLTLVLLVPIAAAVTRALNSLGRLHPAVADLGLAALLGWALGPYLPTLARVADIQVEHPILAAGRTADAAGEEVFTLDVADTGGVPAPERFDWRYYRAYVRAAWIPRHGDQPPVHPLRELMARPDPTGALVLLPLSCYRPVFGHLTGGNGTDLVLLDDKAWVSHAHRLDPRHTGERLTSGRLVPCLREPEQAVCAAPASDGTCVTWACSTVRRPDVDPFYEHPACVEVRTTLALETIVEATVPPWTLGTENTDVLSPGGPIGLYRVTGRREPPATAPAHATAPPP